MSTYRGDLALPYFIQRYQAANVEKLLFWFHVANIYWRSMEAVMLINISPKPNVFHTTDLPILTHQTPNCISLIKRPGICFGITLYFSFSILAVLAPINGNDLFFPLLQIIFSCRKEKAFTASDMYPMRLHYIILRFCQTNLTCHAHISLFSYK